MTDEEIAEHEKQWVAALRSGEYEQGKHQLCTLDGKYCCLGVAEVLAGSVFREDGRRRLVAYPADGGLSDTMALTSGGIAWLGVPNSCPKLQDGSDLATLNDEDGLSFHEIADLIEKVGLQR